MAPYTRSGYLVFEGLLVWVSLLMETEDAENGGRPDYSLAAKIQDLESLRDAVAVTGWSSGHVSLPSWPLSTWRGDNCSLPASVPLLGLAAFANFSPRDLRAPCAATSTACSELPAAHRKRLLLRVCRAGRGASAARQDGPEDQHYGRVRQRGQRIALDLNAVDASSAGSNPVCRVKHRRQHRTCWHCNREGARSGLLAVHA